MNYNEISKIQEEISFNEKMVEIWQRNEEKLRRQMNDLEDQMKSNNYLYQDHAVFFEDNGNKITFSNSSDPTESLELFLLGRTPIE